MTADPKPAPGRRARRSAARRRRSAVEQAAAIRWHHKTIALGCRACPALGEECDGEVKAHHVLRQQFVRGHVEARAKAEGLDRRQADELLASLLWDLRNGLGLCYRAHRRHHSRHQPVPWRLVPARARAFAAELGLLHRLEDDYPAGGPVV